MSQQENSWPGRSLPRLLILGILKPEKSIFGGAYIKTILSRHEALVYCLFLDSARGWQIYPSSFTSRVLPFDETRPSGQIPERPFKEKMPAMTASPAPIVHVVCFKLKNAADAAQVQERFAALQQTSLLPDGKQAIVSLKGGTNTSKEGGTKGMTVRVCRGGVVPPTSNIIIEPPADKAEHGFRTD